MPSKTNEKDALWPRVEFGKINNTFELPNLIEVQTEPYRKFIEKDINEIFEHFFPIVRPDGEAVLTMDRWWINDPKISPQQAKKESKTYESAIYADMTLTINSSNDQIPKGVIEDETLLVKNFVQEHVKTKVTLIKNDGDYYHFKSEKTKNANIEIILNIKKRLENSILINYTINHTGTVFFGDFPKMTSKGTFIINGSEKVVVLQIVRSPGAYFKKDLNFKTGDETTYLDIIPSRGTWLEFKSEVKRKALKGFKPLKQFYVKIDKSRKVSMTNLLTALGLRKSHVTELFDNNEYIASTYELDGLVDDHSTDYKHAVNEIYRKIRAGEIATSEGATRFLHSLLFDNRRYDLMKAGRYKLNQKLNVLNRARGQILAESIRNSKQEILMKKGVLITGRNLTKLKNILQSGVCDYEIKCSAVIPGAKTVEKIKIYETNTPEEINKDTKVVTLVGTKSEITKNHHITVAAIVASISYLLNLSDGIGETDDIDNLGNRRVRTVGELLQNQLRIGMLRIEKNVKEKMVTFSAFNMHPSKIISNKPLTAVVGEFFNLSQLCQFLDQTNPLSELANKRRLTALGPGGLSRERAGLEVRDVHHSHYGRLGPIQTPEGPNIGLINNLATYAKINEYGFIETPYRKVNNGHITKTVEYLSADKEKFFVIAQANTATDSKDNIIKDTVVARYNGGNVLAEKSKVDYIDISPKQIVAISTSAIPFLEKDDTSRALMGANMQGQATPLIHPVSPIVGTGVEGRIARDSGLAIVAKEGGMVRYADSQRIVVESKTNTIEYPLYNFERSNQKTALVHKALVTTGQRVKKDQILADGPSMQGGELALGQNVLVAFTTWRGYNFEDAIIISERLQIDDVFTSLHITEYKIERRRTKQGAEEITSEIPNISNDARSKLNEDGFAMIGAEVKCGDILVGKVTPKGQVQLSPEDKLIQAIFGEKSKGVKDNSLRVPNGGDGIVQSISRLTSQDCNLPNDVLEIIKVYVVQKRKIQEGDKMAGRHGNKGVISIVLPAEDMPFTEDGTPIDILLNPLGVPSRMNIGQVLEMHLGLAGQKTKRKFATPVFESISEQQLNDVMKEANIENYGKQILFDGRTGDPFDNPIATGVMYILKLGHMVDDKLHVRNIGPYSLITQQPLGGKAQNGGQRFGEMEVWALEAYGAAHTLREILTIKSDDIRGRIDAYQALVWGRDVPPPGVPESFNVLTREIRGLGFDIRLTDSEGATINQSEVELEARDFIEFEDISGNSAAVPSVDTELENLFADKAENSDEQQEDEGEIYEDQ